MSSSFSRTQISHYLLHICPFKAWDKMSAGPQGMETSHDLAFRNIPLPHTSDEKGFQPWGWKYTPSSRVPLLPLLNATSWNHPRTPAVAQTHTHTSAYAWVMHPGVDVRTHPLCTGAWRAAPREGSSSLSSSLEALLHWSPPTTCSVCSSPESPEQHIRQRE